MQLDRIAVVIPYLKGQDVNLRSGAKWLLKRLKILDLRSVWSFWFYWNYLFCAKGFVDLLTISFFYAVVKTLEAQ